MAKLLTIILISVVVHFARVSALLGTDEVLPALLRTCLNNTGANVVYPGDARYHKLSYPQNANYQTHPEAIVIPALTEEVAATMRCMAAEKGNIKLSARGGGHSYAAYGYSGQVILDPSQMRAISFDDERREVTVQFGQTLGPLAMAMGRKGYALPHGTCPTVGVAGHSLGGGWGFPSRKWGWLVDRIVSVEFVDISGNIRWLNSSSTGNDADLWWALRGAGSNNFGIVTSFIFAMEKAPTSIVNYELYFGSESDCTQVLLEVQKTGMLPADHPNGLPLELGMEVLLIGRTAADETACILSGQYMGNKSAFSRIIKRLLDKLATKGIVPLESESHVREFRDWLAALTDLMGPLDATTDPLPYYGQSLMDNGTPNYKKQQVVHVFDALRAARSIKGSENDVSFDLLGPSSRTNLPPVTGNMSYAHRRSLFLVQIYSAYFPGFGDPMTRSDALGKITNITNAIKKARPESEWHAYQNYIDPYLADFGHAYYGSELERLKLLKSLADPTLILDFPQGLGRA
ncbi:hypothetical protein EYZ11_011391 [Aspergillus tanneri]|uniref:FAD-binding PCMH-type domain-containing protein n=1 Tax=Aspergillus tanneri TaxID=1220188 RepID=A0A4S3J2Y5_9EURO|nr:uncharacterized protein ATNIH1004_005192 [Aspergillus tanneri]KAA8649291.1 hypothetical protein ATNIH1004_005192 [Aspergillus tanneri]THC89160.1 hypothetical protein EYZ11_011391 [Aspergillus tanneri]